MINENQQLLNDWRSRQYLDGDANVMTAFHFFQKKYTIVQRFDESADNSDCTIVGSTHGPTGRWIDAYFVVAKQYRTAWVVAEAQSGSQWNRAQKAFTASCKAIDAASMRYIDALKEEIRKSDPYRSSVIAVIADFLRPKAKKKRRKRQRK